MVVDMVGSENLSVGCIGWCLRVDTPEMLRSWWVVRERHQGRDIMGETMHWNMEI
jgi:hypothetical protein